MKTNCLKLFLVFGCFFAVSICSIAQINIEKLEREYGEGKIAFKKRIKVSFVYAEEEKTYFAKVTHQYEQLHLSNEESNGLIQIPFNAFQQLKLKRARYFKLDSAGNKTLIENVKVKHADEKDYFISGIFYADLKVKQFKCAVDLPENYFLSYGYEVLYKDLKFLHSIYLQDANEVVKDVEIAIKKNVNVDLAIFEQNLGPNIEKTEDENYIKYSAKSLDRIKTESNSVNGNYYLPHLILSIQSIETTEKITEILKSTQNQYDWYNSLIEELKPNQSYLKELSSYIIKGSTSVEEKINSIYNWVQRNVQYLAFEDGIAGFKPTEADKVAQLKYGDCKGMANLLVNLLKAEGFDARHAWIGTRSNNYSYSIPSLIVDNHMICALNYRQKWYFLDGTSKSATWKNPPASIEGKEVLIADGDNYVIDTIKVSKASENAILFNGTIDLDSPQPKIRLNVILKGHFVRDYYSYLYYIGLDKKESIPYYFVDDYLDGILTESISTPIISEDQISYTIEGKYLKLAKGANSLTLFPYLDILNYSFLEDDVAPAYIDYPHVIAAELTVKRKNSSFSKTGPTKIEFNHSFANYEIIQNDEEYIVKQKIQIEELHSPLKNYEEWNQFVDSIKAFNNHPISYQFDK